MTTGQPHCDHECVCTIFERGSIIATRYGTRCMRNQDGCKPCEHDTRTHTPSTTEADNAIHLIQPVPFTLSAEMQKRMNAGEFIHKKDGAVSSTPEAKQ
jgi:hypothetical protein